MLIQLKLYKDPGYNDFLIKNSLINSSDSPKSRILKFEFQKIFWASSAYFSDDRKTSEKRLFKVVLRKIKIPLCYDFFCKKLVLIKFVPVLASSEGWSQPSPTQGTLTPLTLL